MTDHAPTGTVTFLFTDIEGSTRLWETHPNAMKPLLACHDAILRQAVGNNRGYMVKTTGDGCHAAFGTAADALQATLAAQQALNAEPWSELQPHALRVRMGVHTGEAEARAGDYYGTAVNRAARLMSIGHGGQVLISASTAELSRDFLPAEITLLDLGEHRLKDLNRPEHIFQLAHPSLPSEFPPVKSLDAYPNNLPTQLTSFIGREREINETRQLLSTARLVTLTGSGGTGKTRLAQQVAADVLPTFTDGVWQVELAPVSDPDQVLPSLAAVLKLQPMSGASLVDLVTDTLHNKHMLILMDNCEHLVEACAALADHLLRACPHLKILASSRESLGIAGEVSYRVPSLSVPAPEEIAPEQLSQSEAAQLFINRAVASNPHFQLTGSNAPAVAQVCRRLDGIPLALELAAARIKLFPPEQIAERLNDRFRLLTGGSRTALPRQQTLRALIDWSYDLLSEPERALLRQLSVFVGGWSFEAAEAVCSDLDVLTLLEQLVNKSLVVADEIQGQARYHMLETIRQYGREKLIDAGEAARLRDRHIDYFLRLSQETEPELGSGQAFEVLERLILDDDNLRAGIEWGQEGRPEDALSLIGGLTFYWGFRANDRIQTLRWLDALLTKVKALPVEGSAASRRMGILAKGLNAKGLLLMLQGDISASAAAFTDAITLARECRDELSLAFALSVQSEEAVMEGNPPGGWAAAEEATMLFRKLGQARWLLLSLTSLAGIENRLGNHAKADRLRKECLQYLEHVDHPMFIPSLHNLGTDANFRGQPDEARIYFSKALEVAKQYKYKLFITILESEIAHLDRKKGDLQTAKDAYRKLIWIWKDYGQYAAVAHLLECFAYIALDENELERAARLLGAAEGIREAIQIPMHRDEYQEYELKIAALRGQMDAAALATAWNAGCAMNLESVIRYAIATG